MKKRFLSIMMALCLALSLLPATALAAEGGTQLPTAVDGVITLDENVTLSEAWQPTESVILDLSGYKLSLARVNVQDGVTVTITDSEDSGKIEATSTRSVVVFNGGTLILENGTITSTQLDSNDNIAIFNMGTFTIEDGKIEGGTNAGTGVYNTVRNSGSLVERDVICNIEGGVIEASYGVCAFGPGVPDGDLTQVDNKKLTINITDGTIKTNGQGIATNASSGRYAGFTVNMSGGAIEDIDDASTGMYLPAIGVTNITGGTITASQAIRIGAGELNISSGTITCTAEANGEDLVPGASGGTTGAIVVGKASGGYVGDIVVNVSGRAVIQNTAERTGDEDAVYPTIVVSDKNMADSTNQQFQNPQTGDKIEATFQYSETSTSVFVDTDVYGDIVKISAIDRESGGTQDGGNTTLTIQDAIVTGNVTNQSQTGLIIRDTTIAGNVSNTSNGSTAVLGNSTIIGSAIDDANGGTLYVENGKSTETYYAINARTSKVYTDLNTAISEADDGDTITLLDDVVLDGSGVNNNTGAINFTNKNLTIDGSSARYSITAGSNFGMESAWGTTAAGTSHVINITGSSNVTLKNLTINGDWAGTGTTEDFGSGSVPAGANAARHGINIWNNGETTATVRLENVNVTNCSLYAVVARGADLTIDGLTTTGNRWGVNVEDNSTVTIENADIGETDSIVYEAETEGKLTVEDGSYGTIKTQSNATGQIEIAGGSVDSVENATSATVDITGGTIGNVSNTGTGRIDVDGGRVTGTVNITPNSDECLLRYVVDGVTVYARAMGNADSGTVDMGYTTTPTKRGYTFDGWACNQSGVTISGNRVSGVRAGQTYIFTAQWTENQSSSSDSGSDSEPSYSPVLDVSDGGTVRVSPRTPSEDDEVTITVDPDSGYEVGEVTVTDRNGREIDVTAGRNNTYTFTQPRGRVTIEVTFVREGTSTFFTDVAETYWAYNEIAWAYENGYVNGVTATTFAPGASISRQQIWMILARIAGDDPADMAAARQWSIDNGISDGTNPGSAVTRQQLAALLYRYAQMMGYANEARVDLSSFPDAGSVASYAVEPMQWSVANSIVGGTTDGTLNPTGTATRAQFAVMLYRFWTGV